MQPPVPLPRLGCPLRVRFVSQQVTADKVQRHCEQTAPVVRASTVGRGRRHVESVDVDVDAVDVELVPAARTQQHGPALVTAREPASQNTDVVLDRRRIVRRRGVAPEQPGQVPGAGRVPPT